MPVIPSFVPGEWTDVVPHPAGYAQVVLAGTIANAYVNGSIAWSQEVGRGLYLRATVIDGRVWAAMQRADGKLAVFNGSAYDATHGDVFGQNGVAWSGSKLHVLRSATSSEEFDYTTGAERTFTHKETSQGFFDAVQGPFWTDDAFTNIPGMTLGFTRGVLSLGQSQTALQLRLRYGNDYAVAYDGIAFEPRLVQLDSNTWIGSARTPLGALTLRLTPPFVSDVVIPPPTPPVPPVIPPKEPPVAEDVRRIPNYVDALRAIAKDNPVAFRNAHADYDCQGNPGCTSVEEAERFIRIAAYVLNENVDARIGLNGKRATSTLSQDALCFRHDDGRESVLDVISGAGGPNPSIVWNVVGEYRQAGDGQRWIDPPFIAQEGGTVFPDPDPDPDPDPTPGGGSGSTPGNPPQPVIVNIDLNSVLTAIANANQTVVDVQNALQSFRDRVEDVEHTTRRELAEKLDTLLTIIRSDAQIKLLGQTATISFKNKALPKA